MLAYDQDVVELLHAVDLGQELVDDGVVDTGAARHAASLLADGVDLIEDDDVQSAVGSQLKRKKEKMHYKERERESDAAAL